MTMMIDIDELLTEVLPLAPSCPEPLAIRYLRESARELCKAGRMWRVEDSFEVLAPDYEALCTAPDARVFEFEAPHLNGRKLEPIDIAALDAERPGWNQMPEAVGNGRYVTQIQPNTLTVAPHEQGTLTLRLILVPSRTAITLPEFLVEDYATQIGKGALGRILTHPKGEFANAQLGSMYLAEFQTILGRAGRQFLKGQQKAPLRTIPQHF